MNEDKRVKMVDRIAVVAMGLALYGYLAYNAYWFHWAVLQIPAQLRIVGL